MPRIWTSFAICIIRNSTKNKINSRPTAAAGRHLLYNLTVVTVMWGAWPPRPCPDALLPGPPVGIIWPDQSFIACYGRVARRFS